MTSTVNWKRSQRWRMPQPVLCQLLHLHHRRCHRSLQDLFGGHWLIKSPNLGVKRTAQTLIMPATMTHNRLAEVGTLSQNFADQS